MAASSQCPRIGFKRPLARGRRNNFQEIGFSGRDSLGLGLAANFGSEFRAGRAPEGSKEASNLYPG